MASLREKHLRSHFEDQVFQGHQLLEPVWDLKSRLCRKHRKLQRLYCRTEGCCVCGACLLKEQKNHDTIPLEEECASKEVRPGLGGWGEGEGRSQGTREPSAERGSLSEALGTPFLGGKLCSHYSDGHDGASPVVQWLTLHTSTAGGTGSIPGLRTRLPHAVLRGQKKKKRWSRGSCQDMKSDGKLNE